jgi:hypothetical protein
MKAGYEKDASDHEVEGMEIKSLREDINLQIAYLSEQIDQISSEIESGMPLDLVANVNEMSGLVTGHAFKTHISLQGGNASDDEHNSSRDRVGAASNVDLITRVSGYNVAKDAAELDSVISRYPLSSTNIRMRIREVHTALQERFLERLATWRLECELDSPSDVLRSAKGGRVF